MEEWQSSRLNRPISFVRAGDEPSSSLGPQVFQAVEGTYVPTAPPPTMAMVSDVIARLGTRVFDSKESLLLASEAPAKGPEPSNLEALQRELSQLYEVVPVPGDAVDFFAPTPFAILQELRHVSFVLARAAQTSEEA
ncbi:unnamed protein product, partial [Symbiodinium microadriaticum]